MLRKRQPCDTIAIEFATKPSREAGHSSRERDLRQITFKPYFLSLDRWRDLPTYSCHLFS